MPTDDYLNNRSSQTPLRKKMAMVDQNDAAYRAVAGRGMAIPGAVLLNTSPNGSAPNGSVQPSTQYTLDTARTAPPAANPYSQASMSGPPTPQSAVRTDAALDRVRANIAADVDSQHRYLGQKFAQYSGMGMSPAVAAQMKAEAGIADEAAAWRHQIQLADASSVQGPSVRTPEQNSQALQAGDRSLYNQIGKLSANDPGYQRAAAGVYGRFYGSTPAQDFSQGKLSLLGLNPLENLSTLNRLGMRQSPDAEGYAQRGQSMTDSQTSERQAFIDRANAAAQEYRRYADSRRAGEEYGTEMTAAQRGASLAEVQGNEAEMRARLSMANDPAFIDAIKKSRVSGAQVAAERGALDLEKTRADMELQKRDIAGSRYLDKNAEDLVSQTLPSLNELSDINTTADVLPRATAVSAGLDSLLSRLAVLPPEAQAHYRQRILAELGNPSVEEFDQRSQARNSLLVQAWNAIPTSGHVKARDAVGRIEQSFKKLRPFLFPNQ